MTACRTLMSFWNQDMKRYWLEVITGLIVVALLTICASIAAGADDAVKAGDRPLSLVLRPDKADGQGVSFEWKATKGRAGVWIY
jgi:hypothetical protein